MCKVRKSKGTLFCEISGISAASFQDRSLTMFLKTSSIYGSNAFLFNGKFLLQFNNFRVRSKFVNNYVNFIKNVKISAHLVIQISQGF